MKVKRFISRLALVAVVALFVHAASAEEDVLYFQIDDSPTFDDGINHVYSCVMVALSDSDAPPNPSGDYLTLYGGGGTEWGQALDADSTEPVYVGLGTPTTDSILFELWFEAPEDSGSWERVAYSRVSLADLRSYLVNSMGQGGAGPYVVSNFHVVPEPTGGLLVLLGAAVLALRRKRI